MHNILHKYLNITIPPASDDSLWSMYFDNFHILTDKRGLTFPQVNPALRAWEEERLKVMKTGAMGASSQQISDVHITWQPTLYAIFR